MYLLWLKKKKCVLENLWKDSETLITVVASRDRNWAAGGWGGTEDLFTICSHVPVEFRIMYLQCIVSLYT